MFAPASGKVTAINEELTTASEKINSDAHGSWMVKITLANPGELNNLMSAADYDKYVADLNVMNLERTTRVDVQNAYMDVRRTEKQIQDFRLSRDQAKRNVEVLRLRFQNGLERIIDVFDAENEMRNLDNEYLNLLVQFNTSKDELSKLIGADVETIR